LEALATHRPALQPEHRGPRRGAVVHAVRAPVQPPEHVRLCKSINHAIIDDSMRP
jgi:hypothetical protein